MQRILQLRSFRVWLHGLLSAFIGGGATAFAADQGVALLKRIGVQIELLDLKQLGAVFLSAGFSTAMAFLAKSPLPPLEGKK